MRLLPRHAAAAMIAVLSAQLSFDRAASAQSAQQQQKPPAGAPTQSANDLKPAFDALRAKDYARAERVLKPMAERKDVRAQFMLGAEVYGFAQSPLYDLGKAIPLLRDAAERGFPRAMAVYAGALAEGAGVQQDKVEAYKYMALASRLKVPDTEVMLARLSSEMTDEELDRAKKAADAFVPRQ